MDKIDRLWWLLEQIGNTYRAKNAAYGDSFSKGIEKYGYISALVRMYDKWNRIETLLSGGTNEVKDEAIVDTLQDLACYCLMLRIEIEDREAPDENAK